MGGLKMFFFQYFIQSGDLLRRPALPLGLARPLGDPDGRAAAAALGDAPARRGGHPAVLPGREPAPRGSSRASRHVRRRHGAARRHRRRCDGRVVTVPLLLLGAGIGALASQLGSVTVSSVPDSQSPEVGGLQNTATNIGASLGTALAGSVLVATLTSVFLVGISNNPDVPQRVSDQATVQLAGGIPFISDADLKRPSTTRTSRRAQRRDRRRTRPARALRLARVSRVRSALFFAGGIPPAAEVAPPSPRKKAPTHSEVRRSARMSSTVPSLEVQLGAESTGLRTGSRSRRP